MGHATIPAQLLALLSSAQIGTAYATDALEEWILHRRVKGDTLFDVSVGLAELEDRTPPHLTYAFDRARYLTNVPQPSDLTPPMGPFPLARSASPATILHHLLSQPPPSIEHSREIILEYVLARELKLREKKSGRAGKGTLGREGFEDIGKRMGEIEDGLRGGGGESSLGGSGLTSPKRGESTPMAMSPSRETAYPSPKSPRAFSVGPGALDELNENQQIGLTLVLSLRMSLSYFSLVELAEQLMQLALADAERTLVQHIRRRVPGEGRWGVGKELEYVESLTLPRRPALRPAFRSSKARTLLPPKPLYPIQLPAPSKSQCTKLIQSLAREVESGGPAAGAAFLLAHAPSGVGAGVGGVAGSPAGGQGGYTGERGLLGGKKSTASPTASAFLHRAERDSSPQALSQPLPPLLQTPPRAGPNPPGTPTASSPFGAGTGAPPDQQILANYAMELISEYLTREKREHMLKSKWAKSGRAQLSKDLGEIEASLCMASKSSASFLAPILLPTFLLLRRTFALPPSPLPQAVVEPYIDILPAPPDPDDVPFREPTVGTTTAALYVNPRLEAGKAYEVLEELVEFEREKVEGAGGGWGEVVEWVGGVVESVQKRFPDGSYAEVFARIRENLQTPPQPPSAAALAPYPPAPTHKTSIHRRVKSNAFPPPSPQEGASSNSLAVPSPLGGRGGYGAGYGGGAGASGGLGGGGGGSGGLGGHARSLSMPSRRSTVYDEETDSSSDSDEPLRRPPPVQQVQQPTQGNGQQAQRAPDPRATSQPPQTPPSAPAYLTSNPHPPSNTQPSQDLPHHLPPLSTTHLRDLRAELPPLQMLSPMEMEDADRRMSAASGLSGLSVPSSSGAGAKNGAGARGSTRSESGGGWWDVVSAISPSGPAPWDDTDTDSPAKRSSAASSALGALGASAMGASRGSANLSDGRTSLSLSGSGSGSNLAQSASLPLPPGAEPAHVNAAGQGHVVDFTRPMMDLDLGGSGGAGGDGVGMFGVPEQHSGVGVASPPGTAIPGPAQAQAQAQGQSQTRSSTMHAVPSRPARSPELDPSPPRSNWPPASNGAASRSPEQRAVTLDSPPSASRGYNGYYPSAPDRSPPRFERPPALGSGGSYGSSGSEQATPTPFGGPTLAAGPPAPSPGLQSYPGKLFPSPTAPGPAAGQGRPSVTPPFAPSPPAAPAPQTKSKFSSFGRSMSLAGRSHKKDKEGKKDGGKDGGKDGKEGGKVQNDPGRWNKDMVASIMGPSAAERR
ncbi:hypothetical protein IAT38_008329 [Cryptococcus sp. DSM 104549]